jgi:hypothetical protein
MGETHDRGVLASTECIQQLKEAQARQRNAEGKVLKALAQGNSPTATDEISIAAYRRLRRYHVIERLDGEIDKIEIPLFEQWVRDRAIET